MADVLLLNADAQPVSYMPLSAIAWKDAVTYMWLDKVTVLEWYDDWVVHSASWETRVPAVIMLKEMLRRARSPKFSKHNVYLRDLYTCQYCLDVFPRAELTLDHVVPRKHGGKTHWENIVASCGPCNNKKGDSLTPLPKTMPYKPDYYELVNKRKQMAFEIRHPAWSDYI